MNKFFSILFYVSNLIWLSESINLFDGLQNYWTFDNHTNDTIGNANLYNGVKVNFVPDSFGNSDSAVYLNQGYFIAPDGVYFSGDHTVSVWVKVINFENNARIIDFGNGESSDNIVLTISYNGNERPSSTIYNSNQRDSFVKSDVALIQNVWTHLAHTYSNGICRIYLNSFLTAADVCNAPRALIRSSNYVGKSNWNDPDLNALIDELRIYNRSLDETELNHLAAFVPARSTTMSTSTSTTTTPSTTKTSTTSSQTTSSTTTTTGSTTITTTSTNKTSTKADTSTTTTTTTTITTTSTNKTSTKADTSTTTTTTSNNTSTSTSLILSSISSSRTTQTATTNSTSTFTPTTNISISTSTRANLTVKIDSPSLAYTKPSNFIFNSFYFSQLNSSELISLLNSSYDLNGCMLNCSNKGTCLFDFFNNKYICSCNSIYLSGYACQIDTRPCSSNPCLNNGTCVDSSHSDNSNSSSFSCVCDKYHIGTYCESEIDICQNETCSSNGNCFDLNKLAKCKCFSMYSGDKCELESNELKTIKAIISFASILAIIIIFVFFSYIILMDISKFFCNKGKRHLRRRNKPVIKKYVYVNFKQ